MLDDYFYTNPKEYRMHSDAVKFTERIRWKAPGVIAYSLTDDDPKIFTAPWTQEFEVIAKPDWAPRVCTNTSAKKITAALAANA